MELKSHPRQICKALSRPAKAVRPLSGIDHMPYLPNLASSNEEVYSKSVEALARELERCQILGIPYLVTHLGSHLGWGLKSGLARIVAALQTVFSECDSDTVLLLENSAGTKNSMGSTFSDIAAVLKSLPAERGVWAFAWIHVIFMPQDTTCDPLRALQATLDQFQDCIGLETLMLIHLNDCQGAIGSHLDRHEHIGLGQIGEEGFRAILVHPALAGLAMILETPVDARRDDKGNLDEARRLASGIK